MHMNRVSGTYLLVAIKYQQAVAFVFFKHRLVAMSRQVFISGTCQLVTSQPLEYASQPWPGGQKILIDRAQGRHQTLCQPLIQQGNIWADTCSKVLVVADPKG